MDFERIKQNLSDALRHLMALRLIVSSPSRKVADLPAAYVLIAALMAPWVCLFAVALVAAICLSIPFIQDIGKEKFQIGQNYSTVKPSTEPSVVSTEGE